MEFETFPDRQGLIEELERALFGPPLKSEETDYFLEHSCRLEIRDVHEDGTILPARHHSFWHHQVRHSKRSSAATLVWSLEDPAVQHRVTLIQDESYVAEAFGSAVDWVNDPGTALPEEVKSPSSRLRLLWLPRFQFYFWLVTSAERDPSHLLPLTGPLHLMTDLPAFAFQTFDRVESVLGRVDDAWGVGG